MMLYYILSSAQTVTMEEIMRKLNIEKVRDLITLRGMTVSEFARKLGEQQQTVQKWTSGNRNPKPKNMNKIAEQLGVPVTEISTVVFDVSKSEIQELNREIEEITGMWSRLTAEQRSAVMQLVRSMANGAKSEQ